MGIERQGIVRKESGYTTLDEHIRMPQDPEYVEDKPEATTPTVTDSKPGKSKKSEA